MLSADETLSLWSKWYGCDPTPSQEALDVNSEDGVTVTRSEWGNCSDGARLVQLRYEGGGHVWYGMENDRPLLRKIVGEGGVDVSATTQVIAFFGLDT